MYQCTKAWVIKSPNVEKEKVFNKSHENLKVDESLSWEWWVYSRNIERKKLIKKEVEDEEFKFVGSSWNLHFKLFYPCNFISYFINLFFKKCLKINNLSICIFIFTEKRPEKCFGNAQCYVNQLWEIAIVDFYSNFLGVKDTSEIDPQLFATR